MTRLIATLLLIAGASLELRAEMSVVLNPAVPSPVPVGFGLGLTAEVKEAGPDTLVYRFRTRLAGGEFSMARDYAPGNTLEWTPSEPEGLYQIEASVRNLTT